MLLSVTQAQPPPLPHPARMLAHPQAQAFRSTSPSLDPQDAGRREQLLAGPSWLPPGLQVVTTTILWLFILNALSTPLPLSKALVWALVFTSIKQG